MALSSYRQERLRFAAVEAEAGVRALRSALDPGEPSDLAAAASLLERAGAAAARAWRSLDSQERRVGAVAEPPIAVMPKRVRPVRRGGG